MSEFTKADGAKIQIEFSQPLVGDCAGNEGAFTVTVPEYTMVPGGEIEYNQKAVKSTSVRTFVNETLDIEAGNLTHTDASEGNLRLKELATKSRFKYYGDALLPEIPVDESFPYYFIRKDSSGYYNLFVHKLEPMYYNGVIYNFDKSSVTGDNTKWYRLPVEFSDTDDWTLYGVPPYSYAGWGIDSSRVVIWSSVDITVNNTSTIYFPAVEVRNETDGYETTGVAVYTVGGISGNVDASIIAWDEEKPEGTTVAVSVSADGMNFTQVTNGGQLIPAGAYDNATATIKVELATENTSTTPVMSNLRATLQTTEDRNFLILEMEPLQRFCNAAGPITVAYSGGTLAGQGGPVADFSVQFTATDLLHKNHPHDMEHISVSVQASGVLKKVAYFDTAENEHIEISVTAVGVLKHIDDL